MYQTCKVDCIYSNLIGIVSVMAGKTKLHKHVTDKFKTHFIRKRVP